MTKIYIETAGCALNIADSEQMAGELAKADFKIIDNIEDADIVIFNTCTVKSPTEDTFFNRLKQIEKEYPYKIIIVAGCIAQTATKKLKKYPLVGTREINNIVQVVEEALNDNIIKSLSLKTNPELNLARLRKNNYISIIPISRGCLGNCTYCKTKQARGRLISYSIETIVEEVKSSLKDNAQEIWLTSQDTGCYGFDIKTNLAELIKEILKINAQFKIRIGMMNPNHLITIKDQLLPLFNDPRLFKFLHLPIQSANNEILQKMNRNYTIEDVRKLFDEIREKVPRITLSTDIIVGFPGETERQYWDTMDFIRAYSPECLNISKYWARPETEAKKMKQLPIDTIQHRSKILTDIKKNVVKIKNEQWLGWEGEIIIDEKGKNDNQFIGRNDWYKQIVVEGNFKFGQKVKVKINKFDTFTLYGKLI